MPRLHIRRLMSFAIGQHTREAGTRIVNRLNVALLPPSDTPSTERAHPAPIAPFARPSKTAFGKMTRKIPKTKKYPMSVEIAVVSPWPKSCWCGRRQEAGDAGSRTQAPLSWSQRLCGPLYRTPHGQHLG